MKILIVDDNADDRKVLRYNLENHGCKNVIEARDGQEGLALARSQRPDLIISDALMPTMDGFQFLRGLKTDDTLKSIPFIFYSAVYTGHQEAELATSLGAESFIVKPQDPDEFWTAVIGILEECKLKKPKGLTGELIGEEEDFLRKYSHIVAAKLEEKVRELEKAKTAVEAKEQEWQTTFDSIGDCVTIHDSDYNVLLANKACEKFLGASQAELRSRKCYDLFHGMQGPHEACPKLVTERTGKPCETELFEPRCNCWLAISCFPILDKNGAVRRVVHFAKDITQRKKMEKELRESEEKYRTLVDDAPVGVYRSNLDGAFLYVNDALVRIFESESVEELLKTPVLARYKTSAERERFIEKIRKDGKVNYYPLEVQTKTGRRINIVISATLDHEVMSGMVLDITEQKKLEEQLRQAQKMQAIGTLAGGVAHDFNNILTAIIGYGHLTLIKMAQDDPHRLNIESILEAADRAAHLTQELLLFSRKQISELKPIDLNKVVGQVEKFLKRVIGEDIACKKTLTNHPLTVFADSHQLEQVLMNLATNAHDAMPGGGTFTVTTEAVALQEDFIAAHGYGKRGDYAMITVSDTGKGMDEETRKRIFEPFFTTKEVGKGTGLGLAVVYGIIKQHEGFINVYSEPGKGSTFRIYLPTTASAAGEEVAARQEEAPARGTETVLLAEDDETLRKLTLTVLTEFGYTVIEAVDGEDAVRKFMENKESIHILLFDLVMPKMNGKEAYDEIRKIQPEMKVIFASGYAPDIIRQKMSLEEGAHLLYKPMSPMELLRKVRSVLDGATH